MRFFAWDGAPFLLHNPNALPNNPQHQTRPRLRTNRIVLFGLLLAFIVACSPTASQVLTGNLPMQAPDMIVAGQAVTVTIGPVSVVDGTRVGLMMVGQHGPRVYNGTFEQGVAQFDIPGEHTFPAGQLAFIAAAEDARGHAGVLVRPRTNQPSASGHFIYTVG